MRRPFRFRLSLACALGVLAFPLVAAADHATRPHSDKMQALGHSPHPAAFLAEPDGVRHINSDIAFWEDLIFNGNYNGFRIIRNSPRDPKEVVHQGCNGDQGDIVVWEDILVRSWNSKKSTPRDCDGQTVPAGWEGVHVFDISDVEDPELVGAVELPCGSHTVTVAGISDDRLIVYSNNSSGAGCTGGPENGDFMDVIAVPLDDPASASLIHREPLSGPINPATAPGCHDAGVIRGEVNLAACASADATNVFDIGDNDLPGGTLEDPSLLYTISEPGVCSIPGDAACNGRWHSAAFTWDGEVIILGWEPGGGAAPECEETDPPVKKSAFFYDADTGAKLGQWTLPRPQSAAENCTIHNYNVVPTRNGRYILVSGNYQAGTWVTDFTDPANPVTLGWSDPPALDPPDLGGAWSSYWYNNFIYESEITKGLNVFRFHGREARGVRLDHLNPQTQELSDESDD